MRLPARPLTTCLLVAILSGVSACGGPVPEASAPAATVPASTSAAAPPPSCAERTLAGLPLDQQVGQLLLVGVPVDDPMSGVAAMSGVPVGGLFLQGRSSAGAEAIGAALAQLQAAAAIPLQIAADQEGGLVQKLRGPGFDPIPTALAQGREEAATLRSATTAWAGQ